MRSWNGVVAVVCMIKCGDAFIVNNLPSFGPRRGIDSSLPLSLETDVSDSKKSLTSGPSPPDMTAFSLGYSTSFTETPVATCTPSYGVLPPDLVGSYYRSGPAMFSAGSLPPPVNTAVQPKSSVSEDGSDDKSRMVRHPFEGDGAVFAMTFPGGDNNTATARFRYVRTNGFTSERKRGTKFYKGMDDTREGGSGAGDGQGNDFPLPMFRHHLQPGLNKKRKNTSNTRVVYWAKKLLTLWEGGLPYKLDSLALSTEGASQLGGILRTDASFGAKASYDSNKDRMIFYSNGQNNGGSEITMYEFNSKFKLVEADQEYKLPGFAVLSDFGVTENYSVFVQPKVGVSGMQFMMSKDPIKTLTVDGQGEALLHLIPRAGTKTQMRTITIPSDGISHADLQFCNAFEKDQLLYLDVMRTQNTPNPKKSMEWPWATSLSDYADSASKKSLWRYTVDVKKSSVVQMEQIHDSHSFFGVVNPEYSGRPTNFVYANVGALGGDVAPFQGIAKFDCDQKKQVGVWFPKEYEFCGEPMFANKRILEGDDSREEDDGYIISLLFNGRTQQSEVVVLSAQRISDGPVCRIPLGVAIPHGYFGCFSNAPETNWTTEEIARRAKLGDKMEMKGNQWNEVKSDFSGLGLRLDDFEEYFGDIL